MGQVWLCHQCRSKRELVNRLGRSGHVISVTLRESWSTDGTGLAMSSVSDCTSGDFPNVNVLYDYKKNLTIKNSQTS